MGKSDVTLVILSNGPDLYSTRRLVKEAKRQFSTVIVAGTDSGVSIHGASVSLRINHLEGRAVFLPRVSFESLQASLPTLAGITKLGWTCILVNSFSGIVDSHNKALTDLRVASYNSPVIDSEVVGLDKNIKNVLLPDAKFPVILKPLAGTQGVGVFKANSFSQYKDYVRAFKASNTPYMIQRYIENDGDFRVIVVGYKAVACMKRIQSLGEHRANTHQGGLTAKARMTPQIRAVAETAAYRMQLGFCGVDIIRCAETGKLYVLEVNSTPGLEGIEAATDMNVAGKVIRYCRKLGEGESDA